MRQLRRIVALVVLAGIGTVAAAEPAEAKILPYRLTVVGSNHVVGRPVTVVMHPHAQNVLPPSFDFEIRWVKVRKHQRFQAVVRRRGTGILMRQVAPDEYRGTFMPTKAGVHAVYGRMSRGRNPGYPDPIRVRVKR